MSPVLNLTDNEETNFDAIPPGRYFATVFDAEDRETGGGDGAKLPKGTPMIWLHLQITGRVGDDEGPNEESEFYNRRAFANLVIPPESIDGEPYKHFKRMNGTIVGMLKATGYTEEEITAGDFELNTEDLIERELVIQLDRKPNKFKGGELGNNVIGYRSVADVAGTEASGNLL